MRMGAFPVATGDRAHLGEGSQILKKASGASWQRELSLFLSAIPGNSRQQPCPIPKPEPSLIPGTLGCWVSAELQLGPRTLSSTPSSAQDPLGHLSLRKWFSAWGPKAGNGIFQQFPLTKQNRSGTIFFYLILILQ